MYATIASRIYNNNYWDNMEHKEDGTPSPEGKKRRSSVKGLLLGIMYGMGPAHLAESIDKSIQEAQKIISDFYKSFPSVKKWISRTIEDCRKNGYVEDWYGRRRHLPDIQLPRYYARYINNKKENVNFNPFLECENRNVESEELKEYLQRAKACKNSTDLYNVQQSAKMKGIDVGSNTILISKAERQSVNARIQGGAATMTKVAMIKLFNDKQLRDLGFKLLIAVHDELIGECPKENANKVADRLTYIMKTCISDVCNVPFKCDASICKKWYGDEMSYQLQNDYKKLLSDGKDEQSVINYLLQNHSELTENQLKEMLTFE